jgi:hypothetical protein
MWGIEDFEVNAGNEKLVGRKCTCFYGQDLEDISGVKNGREGKTLGEVWCVGEEEGVDG